MPSASGRVGHRRRIVESLEASGHSSARVKSLTLLLSRLRARGTTARRTVESWKETTREEFEMQRRKRTVVALSGITAVGALIGALVVVAAVTTPASGATVAARGDPAGNAVSEWNLIAVNTLVNLPGPAGGAPPASQINMGLTQGAVYDAVNATEPRHHRPYLLKRRFSARASQEAAVASAAYLVLSDLVSAVPTGVPFAGRAGVLAALDARYAAALADIPDRPFKEQGIAAGTAAAAAMIAA